ncbi:MAG: VOC family protein, partial [Blastococcus sp.]
GTEPVMDAPYYVQFDADGQEIGLDPRGASKGLTGPLPYWHVADIHAAVAGLVEAGAREHQAVQDLGGRFIATVEDADGNLIGLVQPA